MQVWTVPSVISNAFSDTCYDESKCLRWNRSHNYDNRGDWRPGIGWFGDYEWLKLLYVICICYYCCICKKLSLNSLSCIFLFQLIKWCTTHNFYFVCFFLLSSLLISHPGSFERKWIAMSALMLSDRWSKVHIVLLVLHSQVWSKPAVGRQNKSTFSCEYLLFHLWQKVIHDFLMNWRQNNLMLHRCLWSCWWCDILLLRV